MIKIEVCIGSACHIKGSYNVLSSFQQLREEFGLSEQVEVNAVFCLGHCTEAVSVKVNDGDVQSVSGLTARDFFVKKILPLGGR